MIITSIDYGMPTYAEPEIITFTASGSTATASAIPNGTVVELYASEDCYIAFGATAPTASSSMHRLAKDTATRYTMHGPTFIAVRGMVNGGTLAITKLVFGGGA